MTSNPVVVSPRLTAGAAMDLALVRGVHYLLVIDGYRLVGVVCGCDLYRADAGMPVADCMRTRPITIDDQKTAEAASESMQARGIGCLPVVDWSGTLRGVVTRHDLRAAGLFSRGRASRCPGCGSTHGLPPDDIDDARFCRRCVDEATMPRCAIDETYFTLGGGD